MRFSKSVLQSVLGFVCGTLSCIHVSENQDQMTFSLTNVTRNVEKLIKTSMSLVEEFSDNVLSFQEVDGSPCLDISISEQRNGLLGAVERTRERIFMNLSLQFFHSNASDRKKQNTILHEFGHVFGLPHSNKSREIMFPFGNVKNQVVSRIAFAKAIRRQFSRHNRRKRQRHSHKRQPVERIVNASIIPTSFHGCLKKNGLVAFSFSKSFFDFKFSQHIRETIDVCHKFLETISPLRFEEVDPSTTASCIEYLFDDHPHCDVHELFAFPSGHIPKFKTKSLKFLLHFIHHLQRSHHRSSQTSPQRVVFQPSLVLLPNTERDCIDFNEFHSDGAEYSPIVFFFFTFLTKVLGIVPHYDGLSSFLDPEGMFHDDIVVNNSFGDFTVLVKVITMYLKSSS